MMSAPKHPFQQPSTQIIEVGGDEVHQFPPDAAGPLAIVLTVTTVTGGQRITFREQTSTSRANATPIAAENALEGEAMVPSAFGTVSVGGYVTTFSLPGRDEMLAVPTYRQFFVFPDFLYGRISRGLYRGSYSTSPISPGSACYVNGVQYDGTVSSMTGPSTSYVGYRIDDFAGLPCFWIDKKYGSRWGTGPMSPGIVTPLPAGVYSPILGASTNYIFTDDAVIATISGLIIGGSGGTIRSVVGPASTWPSGATRTIIGSFAPGNFVYNLPVTGLGDGELTFYDLELFPSAASGISGQGSIVRPV